MTATTETDPFQEGYDLGCEETESGLLVGLCAYALGVGSCSFGCYDEPSCQTSCPQDGWPTDSLVQPLLDLMPPKRYEVAHALRPDVPQSVERWDPLAGWQQWQPTDGEAASLFAPGLGGFMANGDDRMHGLRVRPVEAAGVSE